LPSTEQPGEVPSAELARAWLDRTAAAFALLLVLGPLLAWQSGWAIALDRTRGGSTFFVQYRRHEPIFLALMATVALATALIARRPAAEPRTSMFSPAGSSAWGARRLIGAAVLVFVVTALGTWGVMHALPLSMDEYVADFQSRIFAAGRLTATVPSEWQRFTAALRPVYVAADHDGTFWVSSYWPVYSAIRAVFAASGAATLLNPVLAGLSVVLVYACSRRVWPNETPRAWLAVAFLVSSSQFVFTSMSAYAMPAHLFFNLLWLYAFLRGDRPGWIVAPIIGVAALGLHNPFPHALFVTPFLFQLLKQKRWSWTAYFGVVYAAGIALWFAWMQALQSSLSGAADASQVFAVPGLPMLGIQGLSLSLLLSWQTPVFAVLLVWIAFAWRTLAETERNLLAGIALSFLFYFFFPRPQGHGWGYRYTYAVLGNMALLGSLGAARMAEVFGRSLVRRLLIASAALTIFVQWPIRAWQIERYVRPFARAHEYVAHIDADVVIVDPTTSWYGIDLIRNDPFLRQKPKILSALYLRPADKRALGERFGNRVHLLEAREIAQFGIPTYPSKSKRPVWPPDPVTRPAAPPPGPPASPAAPAPSSPAPRSVRESPTR